MSKELEALKRVVNEISNYKLRGIGDENWLGIQDILKDINTLEEALKRNEPMKPKVAWKNEEDENIVVYRCLNCNGSLGAKLDNKPMFPNFCRHCGREQDWSDER